VIVVQLAWHRSPSSPPGPPMTLGNMREEGARHLIAHGPNE
jgi:hypothetical protein